MTVARVTAVRTMMAAGESDAAIARALGITKGVLSGIIWRNKLRTGGVSPINPRAIWSDEEIADVRERAARGESVRDIGLAFGICRQTARGRMRRLEITTAPPPIIAEPRMVASKTALKPEPARRKPALPGHASAKRGSHIIAGNTLPPLGAISVAVPVKQAAPVKMAVPEHASRIGECTFITSEGRPWRYCDAPTLPNKPMCGEHHARCFIPNTRNGRDGFVTAVAVARMQDRGTLTAVGAAWNGSDPHNSKYTASN